MYLAASRMMVVVVAVVVVVVMVLYRCLSDLRHETDTLHTYTHSSSDRKVYRE